MEILRAIPHDDNDPGTLTIASSAMRQLTVFVEAAWQGLDYAAHARTMMEIVARSPYVAGPPRDLNSEEIERCARLEAFAVAQAPHFTYLHELAAFRLWAILENAAEDLVRECLRCIPEFRQRPEFTRIKGSVVEFASKSATEQIEFLVARQKEQLDSAFKIGIGRFECLLGTIELSGNVNDLVRRILLELAETRNVIAHRNGRVDKRFIERCPWFSATVGRPLYLTGRHFERYVVAARWYLVELSRRLAVKYAASDNRPVDTSSETATLQVLESRLEELALPDDQSETGLSPQAEDFP